MGFAPWFYTASSYIRCAPQPRLGNGYLVKFYLGISCTDLLSVRDAKAVRTSPFTSYMKGKIHDTP